MMKAAALVDKPRRRAPQFGQTLALLAISWPQTRQAVNRRVIEWLF